MPGRLRSSHDPFAVSAIDTFLRFDTVGALGAVGFVVAVNGLIVREPGVWLILPFLAVLLGALTLARRALDQGRAPQALALAAAGNWIVAIAVAALFPFLWPVMALTVLMPLVLATPHLEARAVVVAIALAAAVSSAVAAIGLGFDDGGVIDDIADEFEFILVVGALAAQIVPIALITWFNNRLQSDALDAATVLNDRLTASESALAVSRRRVVEAADHERRRIERDIHDGAQQRLIALGMRLRLIEGEADGEARRAATRSIVEELESAVEELRHLAHGIYPPLLEARGVAEALAGVARTSPLDLTTAIDDIGRHDPLVEASVFFVALEVLTNVSKHAPDAAVTLSLTREGDDMVLTVVDDGPGFDVDRIERGPSAGRQNMADRAAVIGADLRIESADGRGTSVVLSVPVGVTVA